MTETTIIGAIRTWLEQCPLLAGAQLGVDFLPERPQPGQKFFSVDTQPGTTVIKQYTGGGSLCQHLFALRSVEVYDGDTLQSIGNCGFYEAFADWMQAQSRSGNFPQLPPGKVAQCIEAKSPGYLYAPGSGAGRYLIQCKLQYFRE